MASRKRPAKAPAKKPPKRPTYSDQDRARALTIAEATSLKEASEQTGIPTGTIKRWRHELRQSGGDGAVTAVAQEAVEEVRGSEELRDVITRVMSRIEQKQAEIADQAYSAASFAIQVAEELVREARNQDDINYPMLIRAAVGLFAQAVEKGQLVSGKATARQEGRYEHSYSSDLKSRIDSLAARIGETEVPCEPE